MDVIRRWVRRLDLWKATFMLVVNVILILPLPRVSSSIAILPILGEFLYKICHIYSIIHFICLFCIILLLTACLLLKRPNVNFRRIVSSLLGGDIGTLFGWVTMVWAVVYLGWITDYLREGYPLASAISAEMFLINLLLFMCLMAKPEIKGWGKVEPDPKKVLILPLSNPNLDRLRDVPEEIRKEIKDKKEYYTVLRCLIERFVYNRDKCQIGRCTVEVSKFDRFNWKVGALSIAHHFPELERVYLITSDKSSPYFDEFAKGVREFFKASGRKGIEVEEVGPLDFDDYLQILRRLDETLMRINRLGYRDTDISFNISGGTSAVTAAIIIAAVKEGRQIEYLEQSTGSRLLRIDVSFLQVKAFLGED